MRSNVQPALFPIAVALGFFAALPCEVTHAYEDQVTLAAGAGYGLQVSDALPNHAVLFDVNASFGLSAVWSVRGRLSYGLHPAGGASPLHTGLLGAELLYMVDVVSFVPYVGLGVDAVGRALGDSATLNPAGHVVAGIDYLVARDWAIGFDARPHLLLGGRSDSRFFLALTLYACLFFDR